MEGHFGCFHLSAIVHNDSAWGFPGGTSGKEPACQCRRHKRHMFNTWVRKNPLEEGTAVILHYSCLENPMDKGAWRATVHRVAQSWTWLKRLSTHARCSEHESIIICSSPCLQSFGICTQKWNHWIIRWFYAWFFERLSSCRGHTILHSHQSWWIWIAISPHPQQHLLFSDFLFIIAIPIRHRFLAHITPVHS